MGFWRLLIRVTVSYTPAPPYYGYGIIYPQTVLIIKAPIVPFAGSSLIFSHFYIRRSEGHSRYEAAARSEA